MLMSACKNDTKSLQNLYTEGLVDQVGASPAAQATVGGIKPADVAKIQNALRPAAKVFLQTLFRSKMVPGAERNTPSDQDATAFITAVIPYINQLRLTVAQQMQVTAQNKTANTPQTPTAPTPAPTA